MITLALSRRGTRWKVWQRMAGDVAGVTQSIVGYAPMMGAMAGAMAAGAMAGAMGGMGGMGGMAPQMMMPQMMPQQQAPNMGMAFGAPQGVGAMGMIPDGTFAGNGGGMGGMGGMPPPQPVSTPPKEKDAGPDPFADLNAFKM